MDKYITMSQQELKKYGIIKQLIDKKINGTEASGILNLTVRHIRRLKRKVLEGGAKGLIHASRGQDGNRKMPDQERQKIIDIVSKKYFDFGPTLATEKLEEQHKIKRHVSTIRTIMINEKIWRPKNKKLEIHREWRQRKTSLGEMIQYDGSYEYWFGNIETCLLAGIDDATGKIWARFDNHEGIEPSYNYWRNYLERFGKPLSIYVDKFSTYSMNHQLAKENYDTLTQFERAMEKDLGIEVIKANSPQAKGRIERLFKTLQDRLIKELRLKNITAIEEANKFLDEEFISKFNAKFTVEPRNQTNLHKPLSKIEKNNLDAIFSRQYERTVNNNFTINHKKSCYQLIEEQPVTICKRDKIAIEERMDKTVHFKLRGKYLNYKLFQKNLERLIYQRLNCHGCYLKRLLISQQRIILGGKEPVWNTLKN